MPSGGGSTSINERPLSQEEKDLLAAQTRAANRQEEWATAFEPVILDYMGYKQEPAATEGGKPTLRKLTDEERLAGMSSLERQNWELEKGLKEKELQALKGELPVSPALEAGLAKEEETLQNDISATSGPFSKFNSGAITRLGEFKKRADLVREEARRGMLTTAAGLQLGQTGANQGYANNVISQGSAIPSQWGGVLSGYKSIMDPLTAQRMQLTQMDQSAAMQRQANQASFMGGLFQAGGMLGAAALLSARKAKKNIVPAKEGKALAEVKKAPVYEFNYKGEPEGTPKRTGYMADEAPGDSGDGTYLDLGRVTGLHAAAIKAMGKKIDKIEKRIKEK